MSPHDQHLATRRAAGLFDFSFMGLYEFSGLASLERLLTRPLQEMKPGQIAYTLLLEDDGAVLIDATVWRLDAERFWLFTGKRAGYGGRDRSGEYVILALQGPESGRILARMFGKDALLGLKYFRFEQKNSMLVARLGYSGELGYELMVPAVEGARLRQALLEHEVPECSFDAANTLRLESGYVLFDREIDGHANPRELGLERLVYTTRNFTLTKKLVGLELLNKEQTGQPAQLTSECWSPTLEKQIGLGFVSPEVLPGNAVRVSDGRSARVAKLPFYDPERRRPRGAPL